MHLTVANIFEIYVFLTHDMHENKATNKSLKYQKSQLSSFFCHFLSFIFQLSSI